MELSQYKLNPDTKGSIDFSFSYVLMSYRHPPENI